MNEMDFKITTISTIKKLVTNLKPKSFVKNYQPGGFHIIKREVKLLSKHEV